MMFVKSYKKYLHDKDKATPIIVQSLISSLGLSMAGVFRRLL